MEKKYFFKNVDFKKISSISKFWSWPKNTLKSFIVLIFKTREGSVFCVKTWVWNKKIMWISKQKYALPNFLKNRILWKIITNRRWTAEFPIFVLQQIFIRLKQMQEKRVWHQFDLFSTFVSSFFSTLFSTFFRPFSVLAPKSYLRPFLYFDHSTFNQTLLPQNCITKLYHKIVSRSPLEIRPLYFELFQIWIY